MSLDLLTETVLTCAGPLLFVGCVWALTVWALNFPDARTEWHRQLISADPPPKSKQTTVRSFKDKTKDTTH